ncbi:MAG: hypothetical protein U0L06_04360 [Agathobacter sp.]|nr:hypothetical protein [Agathobacter sp.]
MNEMKWIPVYDVVPGSTEIVLITLDYGDLGFCEVTTGVYMENKEGKHEWFERRDEFDKIPDNSKVVAWMRLPKPYTE